MAEFNDENVLPKFLQDKLSLECKELISTLPKEDSPHNLTFYQYEGFWMAPFVLQGILSCQKHFQALDTDILLSTSPKSGTTWLKAWVFAVVNRKTYTNFHKQHPLLTTNPHDLIPFLEIKIYCDKDFVPNLNSLPSPRLFSTHMPYALLPKSVKESRCKVIYLCRDPKDIFVSLWHFTNKVRPQIGKETTSLEEEFENFCRGVIPYGPLWDNILGYWNESLERSEKILFLRFEEMKKQPICCLKKIARFMGCPFSEEEESAGVVNDILNLCSLENLRSLEVNKTGKLELGLENKHFFRRGQVGDSENLLTSDMVERLNTITKEKFTEHGLRF